MWQVSSIIHIYRVKEVLRTVNSVQIPEKFILIELRYCLNCTQTLKSEEEKSFNSEN